MITGSTVKEAVRILMSGLLDYAGLFPPAQLSMSAAVDNFLSYRSSEDAWMLGRFVVPSSRLEECVTALQRSREAESAPIPLSVLIGFPEMSAIHSFAAFNQRYAESLARITTVECKLTTKGDAKKFAQAVSGGFVLYCEIPLTGEFSDLISEVADAGLRAKLRTGGVTQDLIPATSDVVRFLFACAAKRLPFKATAGLHHPLRGVYPLTYARRAPTGTMHGFLNLFLAAAFLVEGMEVTEAMQVVEESDPTSLQFLDDHVQWKSHTLFAERLSIARRGFAMSFGSCSFRDPIDELKDIGLLPPQENKGDERYT